MTQRFVARRWRVALCALSALWFHTASVPAESGPAPASNPPAELPAGPYKMVELADHSTAPWYLLPFDKTGLCEIPATRDFLVAQLGAQNYTDVFIFSHGWNNDWADANALYDSWLKGYVRFVVDHGLKNRGEFRPVFVGIIWPSIDLLSPGERTGFESAASPVRAADLVIGEERNAVRSLAEEIDPKDRQRFYNLAQKNSLNEDEGLELARMLTPVFIRSDSGEELNVSPQDLLETWRYLSIPASQPSGAPRPEPSGGFSLDPRPFLRLASVWKMKDRAGVVGRNEVAALLKSVLNAVDSRVHLIGHSFGAKVLLSALCTGPKQRAVDSVLLLQPAISYLCFSATIPGIGAGGYVDAPNRVTQPILSTFSSADVPLAKVFQFAVRRKIDIGERLLESAPSRPSQYSALGGIGPAPEPNVKTLVFKEYNDLYGLESAGTFRIFGLDCSPKGARGINGHSDISNDVTYWMLFNQINPAGP